MYNDLLLKISDFLDENKWAYNVTKNLEYNNCIIDIKHEIISGIEFSIFGDKDIEISLEIKGEQYELYNNLEDMIYNIKKIILKEVE